MEDFVCECPEGYEGRYCEQYTGLCSRKPCQNGGHCTLNDFWGAMEDFVCECPEGFEGRYCEQPQFWNAWQPGSVCQDYRPDCSQLEQQGRCFKDMFMTRWCPESCGWCDIRPVPATSGSGDPEGRWYGWNSVKPSRFDSWGY